MSAQESAEAVIIVIKKLGKWLMMFVSILVLIFSGIFAYESLNTYYTYDRHKDQVKVYASFHKESCISDFPLFIGIINNSTKKVLKVDVSVIVTKKGRSTKLNNYQSFESDVILEPSKSNGFCYAIYDDNISDPQILNGVDMDVKVSSYSVDFE